MNLLVLLKECLYVFIVKLCDQNGRGLDV